MVLRMAGWPAGPIFGRLVYYQVHWYNPPKAYRSIRITSVSASSLWFVWCRLCSVIPFPSVLLVTRFDNFISRTHLGKVTTRYDPPKAFCYRCIRIMFLFYLFDSYKTNFSVISFLFTFFFACVCVSYNFILREKLVYHDWYNPFCIVFVSLSLISFWFM